MKNTTVLFFSKLFEKGSLFLFFIFFGRYFGKEAFGEYSYFFSIASFLFVFMDLGGEFYQIKLFASGKNVNRLFNISVVKSILFLGIIIPVMILNEYFLGLLILSFYTESLISIFRSSFYFSKKFLFAATFNIVEKTIFVTLFVLNIFSVESLLFMYATLSISKFIHLILVGYKKRNSLKVRNLNIDFIFWKEYLKNSWSYVLHSALVISFAQFSILLLKKFGVSYGDIATYSVAIKIIMAIVTMFPDILFRQYYPLVTQLIYKNEKQNLGDYLNRIRKTNTILSIVLIGVLFLSAKELIFYSFGSEFSDAVLLLIFLSPVLIFRFSMYPYSAILSGSDYNYLKIIASGSSTIINLALNYVLIPKYGIRGAAIAFIATELSLFIIYKISSRKVVELTLFPKNEMLGIVIAFSPWAFISFYDQVSVIVRGVLILLLGLIFLLLRKKFFRLFNFDYN